MGIYLGKTVGYVRVSSREQNLDRQIIALQQYVPMDMIVTDKASGKNLDRPGYQSLKNIMVDGSEKKSLMLRQSIRKCLVHYFIY